MNRKSRFAAALLAGALLLGTSACGTQGTASFASPVELTVWTYYNGDQLETFNRLVEEFNDTVGRERNIEVIASGQGSVNDLETNVMNAAEGKVGAEALPNIFSAYADTAYAIDRMGLVVDLAPYLDEKEREKYIEAYLEEGDFDGDGSIKIFPTAKCTELLFLNDTDWQKFAQAAGADYSDLLTVEGVEVLRLDGRADRCAGRRQGAVRPRRDGELYPRRREGAGRPDLLHKERQDDAEFRPGCRAQTVGQLLCALYQGIFLCVRPFPQRRDQERRPACICRLERGRDLPADAGHPGRRPELRHHDARAALPDVRGL